MTRLNFNCSKFKYVLIAVLLFSSGAVSAAVEEDELRGRVVEVDEQANTVTIRASEVGEALNIPTDSTQTFEVDESTIIRDDVYATQLDDLGNIHENDIVRIDFNAEAGGGMIARNITRDGDDADRAAGGQQVAQADQLPATASAWPLLAAGGLMLWLAAFLIRLRRRQ